MSNPPARRCAPLLVPAGMTVLALLVGCDQPTQKTAPANSTQPNAGASQPSATTRTVRIIKPERKTIHHPIEQPGFNIEAFQETKLFAKISGYVRKWNVDIGDRVHKGDILAVLNVPEMKVDLEQKEAAVRQASAQIEQAKAALVAAKAQRDRFQSQYERMKQIGAAGTVDRENVEETRLSFEAAKAGIEKAQADQAAAEANLEVAKANRDYSKTMLEYTEIRAPFDGVVTQRNLNDGDFVEPALAGNKGKPLFVVDQNDPVRVFVNIPGADASWIKDGDPVNMHLQGAGGELIEGKVTRNARSLDPMSRTLRTEIDLANPQDKLLPGMYVQTSIVVVHRNVWTLPASAIVTTGDQAYCYRVDGNKALRTPVQIGLSGGGLVEVLMKQIKLPSSGDQFRWLEITGEEEIVAANADSLTDGQPVSAAVAEK